MYGFTSTAIPGCATCTCRPSSRATRCARTSRCWPAGQAVAGPGRRRAHAGRGPGRRRRRRRGGLIMAVDDLRSPASRLHRRPGGRRPGPRGARSRGHDPQHRPPAPGDPRHPAHRGPPRRRTGRLGRAGGRLHAPGLREADRGPHLPPDHHPDQPHRLAGQLLQRGAVHPGRREADGRRGAPPGPVDPHPALRVGPHRQPHPLPRRHGRPARAP